MENVISSTQNPKVRHLLLLQQKSQMRRSEGLFVVEGQRELSHCIEAGFQVDTVFVCHEMLAGGTVPGILSVANEVCEVSKRVYERIAYRGSTEGLMATVHVKTARLADLQLPERPLIVVLEGVEKPGNLGAVLRSADASGADAVVVCDPLTDLYNPNLIRSSIGAVFTVPVVACSSSECITFLKSRNIRILTAQLQDSRLYYDIDMRCATAIVMGTESTGLTNQWREAADNHIRIPMSGRLDSLNVSVSAAILMYEAVRQRSEFATEKS